MKNIFLVIGLFFGFVYLISSIQVYVTFIQYIIFILVFGIFLILINFLIKHFE